MKLCCAPRRSPVGNDVCKKVPRGPNTFPRFYPLSTQKHIIDLARLLSIASDSEMAQAKLKAGSPKAVPLGVFFFPTWHHPHIPTGGCFHWLVAFTGCFHWSGGQSVARSLKQSASGAGSRSASEEEISEHWKILEAHDWQQSYQSIPKVLY